MSLTTPLSAPASTASNTRRSLVVSAGPRPLHLVDGSVPYTAPLVLHSASSLASPPLPIPSSFKPRTASSIKRTKRSSSISYRSSDPDPSSWLSPRSTRTLTPDLLGSFTFTSSPVGSPVQERLPLTLAEKHSGLLHSIAQKESQCLELRSQLAVHEAELLQLKCKWERIVNRGFEKTVDDQPHGGHSSGAVLEGIKEGVQGVSRLIAAGLAIGDLPHSPAAAPSPLLTSRTRPRPASMAVPMRPTHSTAESNSSTASTFTSTTKSTRFSQSSASSFGEDVVTSPGHAGKAAAGKDQWKETEADWYSSSDDNMLMVQDTGATPTMSPNPAFVQRQRRREERELKRGNLGLHQSTSTRSVCARASVEGSEGNGGMTVKRRSRESQSHSRSPLLNDREDTSRTALSHILSDSSHSPVSTSPLEGKDSKAKRASVMMNAAGFPLGSFALTAGSAAVAASAQPVSSWVGNVGRKWEELQKGNLTFAKNQKRASALISDVFSALSPPPPDPSPSSISSASPWSPPKTLSPSPHAVPSYFQPLHPTSTMTASITNSSSLLDLDNDDGGHRGLTQSPYMLMPDAMKLSLPQSLKRQPPGMTGVGGGQEPPNPTMEVMQPTSSSSSSLSLPLPHPKNREREEEWNW